MKEIRLGINIISLLIKDQLRYPAHLVVHTASLAARCGVLLLLYHYVFELRGGEIAGTTFQIAAWSMFLYFSLLSLRLREIHRTMMQDIRSGTIEVLLSKPVSYLFYRNLWQIGSGVHSFLFTTIVGTIALVLTIGIPPTMLSLSFLVTAGVTVLLGLILSLCVYSLIGLCAFWVEDINPLAWIVEKSIMILGGSFLPVAFFPPTMYYLAIWSPLGAMNFITHTVYENWPEKQLLFIGIQLFWIVVMGCVVGAVFRRAHRKVSVNGG